MVFKIDKQTIGDLKMVGGYKGDDVFSFYNRTKTRGGANLMRDMFLYPRSSEDEIMNRVNMIKFFKEKELTFSFKKEAFDVVEDYLKNIDERTRLSAHQDNLQRKFNSAIGADSGYQQLQKGVVNTLQFILDLKSFLNSLDGNGSTAEFGKTIGTINEILNKRNFSFVTELQKISKPNYTKTAEFDQLFRFTESKEDILKLLYYVYEIDVYLALAEISMLHNFSFAEIVNDEANLIEMKGVYHPLVPNAISNNIKITEDNNMVFLTGANMAGKSTFMKTFSIAIYLCHMGFPVPAEKIRFSIQNGMFTTINLADNLNMGFSHFYAEVARVKKVAESLRNNDRMIVVFDELFRGTNVKDAYDATVAVMDAFASNVNVHLLFRPIS